MMRRPTGLILETWNTECFSSQGSKVITVLISRRCLSNWYNNYRSISLLSVASNLLTSIIPCRFFEGWEEEVNVSSGRWGINHVFTFSQILERYHTNYQTTIVVSYDAIDLFNRVVFWDYLLNKGKLSRLTNISKVLYTDILSIVSGFNYFSPLFRSDDEVGRGYLVSHYPSSVTMSTTFWKH